MRKNDIVEIFHDPITRQRPEGKAILKGRIGLAGVVDGIPVGIWRVKFLDEYEIVTRDVAEVEEGAV